MILSLNLTANSQSLEKDSVKISYEELRTFLKQDVKARYCDSLLIAKDTIIELQDGVIVDQGVQIYDLEKKVKRKNKYIIGGVSAAAGIGFIVGLLIR